MFVEVTIVVLLTLLVVYDMYRLYTAKPRKRDRLDELFPEPLNRE